MNLQRIIEVLLLVAGITLLVVGINASHSVADRWSSFFTGHFTDATVWYIVVGITSILASILLALRNLLSKHDD